MKLFNRPVLFVLGALPVMAVAGSGSHWGYEGHEGPDHWAQLSKEYSACGVGQRQSPINITHTTREKLPAILFNYKPSALKVVNNGHTVQVNVADGSGIRVGNDAYKLLQFHFHTPSEEQVQGKNFEMVGHFVHKNNAGQLAVVAVLFDAGKENAALAPVVSKLPEKAGPEQIFAKITVNPASILPDDKGYYTFEGSLTTPPCSEGVRWMVLKTPVQISGDQLKAIKSIVHHNARPVQALYGRVVKESL